MAKRVCIVGAGISGLATLRELIRVNDKSLDVILFEKTSEVGGLWQFAESSDKIGGPGLLYKSLVTNSPRQTWEFHDFPLPADTPTWLTPKHVADHLKAYAEHFKLKSFIKAEVTNIGRRQDRFGEDKWSVTVKSTPDKVSEVFEFDYVIMCSGIFHKPRIPSIDGMKAFEGSVIHSGEYRVPDVYRNKNVLVVGGGVSSAEVCNDIAESASVIYVSRRGPSPFKKLPPNASIYPEVSSLRKNSVIFCDGRERSIDSVIFCTGYHILHCLDVMEKSCDLENKNNFLHPLYKGIVHAKHPTLMFNGLFDLHAALPLFECMAMFISSIVTKAVALPTESEMMKAIESDFDAFFQNQRVPHFYLIGPRQLAYVTELCDLGKFTYPKFPFILFEHIVHKLVVEMVYPEYRNETYTKTSDTTFEIHT